LKFSHHGRTAGGFLVTGASIMDDIVKAAMQKWPDVPDVYGWLALDRRGNWLIRGERIGNAALNAFINRNYASDERGRWFFQNGPQRVFVSLHTAPFVYSLQRDGRALGATAHTGIEARRIDAAFVDGDGAMYLSTDLGAGLVHDRDLALALAAVVGPGDSDENITAMLAGDVQGVRIDTGSAGIPLTRIGFGELAARFHFDPDPQPDL
jgi:hypothetical protein